MIICRIFHPLRKQIILNEAGVEWDACLGRYILDAVNFWSLSCSQHSQLSIYSIKHLHAAISTDGVGQLLYIRVPKHHFAVSNRTERG